MGWGEIAVFAVLAIGAVAAAVWSAPKWLSWQFKLVLFPFIAAAGILLAVNQMHDVCGRLPFVCREVAKKSETIVALAKSEQQPRVVSRVIVERVERVVAAPPAITAPVVAPPSAPAEHAQARPHQGEPARSERRLPERQAASEEFRTASMMAVPRIDVPRRYAPTPRPDVPQVTPPSEDEIVANLMKTELVRLKCLAAARDSRWDEDAVEAVNRFNAYGYTRIAAKPVRKSLNVLKSTAAPVCPS